MPLHVIECEGSTVELRWKFSEENIRGKLCHSVLSQIVCDLLFISMWQWIRETVKSVIPLNIKMAYVKQEH